MGSKILSILKIVGIVVVVVAVVGTGVFFGIKFFKNKDKDKENENNNPQLPTFSTNSYNEAISSGKLTTVNYSGSYTFSVVDSVVFNEYSEDNKNGLTQEDIAQLLKNYGVDSITNFCKKLDENKKAEVTNNNEYITIVTPTDKDGNISSYGVYTKNTKTSVTTGNVYGDENLAVAVIENSEKHTFISLNYNNMNDAINVVENKATQEQIIYVFEDIYSKNNPNLKLFTVTYQYKLNIEKPSTPNDDLYF